MHKEQQCRQYKNILVHSLVNLGDVLLSTSAIALLRSIYPKARITMMVRPAVAEIAINNPLLDDYIIYDYKAKQKSFKNMLAMIKLVRSCKFDLSISFDRKLRPALLTFLAGIPVRVGPARIFDDKPSRVTWLYTNVIHFAPGYDLANSLQAENYQEIIRGFTGINFLAAPVMPPVTRKNEGKASELLANLAQGKKKIALCVKGTFALKDWSQASFSLLIDALKEKYAAVCFIVGAPEDKEYVDTIIAGAESEVANFCGQTTLLDLAAVISKADLFITVDTGAAHIAATTGIAMIVIYGCTSPKRWRPWNDNVAILSTMEPCCPCEKAPIDCPEHNCMQKISVDDVLSRVAKFI